jgi:hypothetical protein
VYNRLGVKKVHAERDIKEYLDHHTFVDLERLVVQQVVQRPVVHHLHDNHHLICLGDEPYGGSDVVVAKGTHHPHFLLKIFDKLRPDLTLSPGPS